MVNIIYESDDLKDVSNIEAVRKAFDELYTRNIIESYSISDGRMQFKIPNRGDLHSDIFRIGAIYGTATLGRRVKNAIKLE